MGSLNQLKGKTIALVCAAHRRSGIVLSEPFLQGLIGQIGDALAEAGCELLISSFPPGLHDWKAAFIDSGRANGIIVLGERHLTESVALLDKSGAPFIVWGATSRAEDHYVVGSDNIRGGYLATRHLLEQGRRRIVFLGYRHANNAELMERFVGYEKALSEFGIVVDEKLVLKPQIEQRHPTFAVINDQLIDSNVSFDGIFATNDMLAIDAISVLSNFGLNVPCDVSIVGFDNQVASQLCEPTLSTIEQDINFGARELVNRLASIIAEGKTKSLRLGVKLVVRNSSTPHKDSKGIVTVRENGMVADVDKKSEEILGYNKQELVGTDIRDILVDEDTTEDGHYSHLDIQRFKIPRYHGVAETIYVHHKNGNALTLDLTVNNDHDNPNLQYLCTISHSDTINHQELSSANFQALFEQAVADRTEELSDTAQRMEKFAFEDGLTGLYNRRYFDNTLKQYYANALEAQQPLSLLLFDVDHFKKYNDNYGHIAGDKCLKFVADALRESFNMTTDLVARYGGEEFVIMLSNTDKTDALHRANRVVQKIHNAHYEHAYSDTAGFITISCGLHTLTYIDNHPTENTNTLLLKADKALYKAKEEGRNRAVSADTKTLTH